ncbi:hypothetical protein BGZ80_005789, partial [Entomortierella chlamydospora]
MWRRIEILKLIENLQVKQDPQNQDFTEFLLRIGDDKVPPVETGVYKDYVRIPNEYIFEPPVNPSNYPDKSSE